MLSEYMQRFAVSVEVSVEYIELHLQAAREQTLEFAREYSHSLYSHALFFSNIFYLNCRLFRNQCVLVAASCRQTVG